MKRRHVVLIALVTLLTAGGAALAWRTFAGRWQTRGPASGSDTAATTYYCPMHPSYRSDEPGNCPICSMKLVPLPKAPPGVPPPGPSLAVGGSSAQTSARPSTAVPASPETTAAATEGPPTIQITPERQQAIGIKFAAAVRVPARIQIRAVGKVAPDETRIAHIHTKVNGWIDEVFVNFVGQPVRRGQPLFTIYSPDLVASQEEYLLALRGRRGLAESSLSQVRENSEELVRAARRRLELQDITPAQIQALEASGKVSRTVTVFSSVSGVVAERAAYHHGLTVTPELDLYTIVDLSRVWVLAEVYESEIEHVKVGQSATVDLPYESDQGAARSGRVTFIAPFVDPKNRTVQVRMEFANPHLLLRPDAFVDVVLARELGARIVVPKDAVMDTGNGQYVFVDKGDGYLEPRPVKAGSEVQNGRVVSEGLREGERVATAANFVVDSESRLKGAFEDMGRPRPQSGALAASQPKLGIATVTSPSPPRVGANTIRVTVTDPAGQPLADAEVELRIFMPPMGAMGPMEARATLEAEKAGQYAGEIEIPAAGSWQTTVTVRRAGQIVGVSASSITAR